MAEQKKVKPAISVTGSIKLNIKGKEITLTMEEAEQLKTQLGIVLKERVQYVPYSYPHYVNVYPFNYDWNRQLTPYYDWSWGKTVSGGGSGTTSGIHTTGYSSTSVPFVGYSSATGNFGDTNYLMDFNPGDSMKIGDTTLTFVSKSEEALKKN